MPNDYKYPNVLEIESSGGRTEYYAETTGFMNAESLADRNEQLPDDAKSVSGHVNGGTDVFSFAGSLKGINWPEGYQYATVHLNGRVQKGFHVNCRKVEVTYPEYSGSKVPYTIVAKGPTDTTLFGSGSTELSGENNPYANSEMADGTIGGGTDTWFVAGFFEGVDSNQNVKATVDDEKEFWALGTPPTGLE